MYRALLLGHGEFAVELLRSVEMILGKQPVGEVGALPLPQGKDLALYQTEIETFVKAGNTTNGCLIFTDIAGGSPFITAAKVYRALHETVPLEIITGMNLPMLIETLTARTEANLAQGCKIAHKEGKDGIQVFSQRLSIVTPAR